MTIIHTIIRFIKRILALPINLVMAANLKHLKHKYIEAIKERDFYANRCCELTEIEFDKDAQIKAFIHSSQNWQRISERYKSHLETIRLNRSSAEDIDKMLSEVR